MKTTAKLANIPVWQNLSKENLKNEAWKPVKGYHGFYEVSSFGRVKRLKSLTKHPKGGLKTIRERILKSAKSNGYRLVMLSVNGSRDNKLVHRLVAESFIHNPEEKPHVNHINGDKWDNKLINLEWNTASENEIHKIHVLGKFSNILNLKYVDSVSEIMQINHKKTIGTKIQKLYDDLKSGSIITTEDKQYGAIYQQIYRLRSEFKVPILDEYFQDENGITFKKWYLKPE